MVVVGRHRLWTLGVIFVTAGIPGVQPVSARIISSEAVGEAQQASPTLAERSARKEIRSDLFRRLPSGNVLYGYGVESQRVMRPGAVIQGRIVALSQPRPSADAIARGEDSPSLRTAADFYTIATLDVQMVFAGTAPQSIEVRVPEIVFEIDGVPYHTEQGSARDRVGALLVGMDVLLAVRQNERTPTGKPKAVDPAEPWRLVSQVWMVDKASNRVALGASHTVTTRSWALEGYAPDPQERSGALSVNWSHSRLQVIEEETNAWQQRAKLWDAFVLWEASHE